MGTDEVLSKIEERIRMSRDPEPCDDYQATGKKIELCSFCGWDYENHRANS